LIPLVAPQLLRNIDYDFAGSPDTITVMAGAVSKLSMTRPTLDRLKNEIPDVIADADLRDDRASEILAQVGDIGSFFWSVLPQSPDQAPYTHLVMKIAHEVSMAVYMRLKHEFGCVRPVELSPQVQPMVRTPTHKSFPMGHSCESFLAALLFLRLTDPISTKGKRPAWDALGKQLRALAWRVGENRIVAGVHFPIDLYAGIALAEWLDEYLAACGSNVLGDYSTGYPVVDGKEFPSYSFDATSFVGKNYDGVNSSTSFASTVKRAVLTPAPIGLLRCTDWELIWEAARREWHWLNGESA